LPPCGVTAGAVAVSPLASRVAFAADANYTGDVLVVLSMHGRLGHPVGRTADR